MKMYRVRIRILVVTLLLTPLLANAQFEEYKAKFIMSMCRNIEWPEEMKSSSFKIAVYGSFGLYRDLAEELMGKTLYNQNIDILNITRLEDLHISSYHIIYIADNNCSSKCINSIKEYSSSYSPLILTEQEGGLNFGSSINFIIRNNKLCFEASDVNARQQGLKFNNLLMNYAYNK